MGVRALDPDITTAIEAAVSKADFAEILCAFETDLDRLSRECAEAAAAGDVAALRRCAHSLAGAAAGIGALRLEAAARQAMQVAPEPPAALAARILKETEAALVELAALAASRSAG